LFPLSPITIPVSGDDSHSILHTVVTSREEINSPQTDCESLSCKVSEETNRKPWRLYLWT